MAGIVGATSQGNQVLVHHGIQNEESDFRVHVGFGNHRLYLFRTSEAQTIVATAKGKYSEFAASQPGITIVTGKGYKVPWKDIPGCVEIAIPADIMQEQNCQFSDLPEDKGRKAMAVAREMLKRGLLPLPLVCREVEDKDIQIKGKDLIVTMRLALQVKCDYMGGVSGLRLQTAECNPLGRH